MGLSFSLTAGVGGVQRGIRKDLSDCPSVRPTRSDRDRPTDFWGPGKKIPDVCRLVGP